MKDLKFFKSGALIATLRVDSISGDGNLTVMETYGLDDRQADESLSADQLALIANFKKLPFDLTTLTAFATDNSMLMVMADSDTKERLVGTALSAVADANGQDGVAYEEPLVENGSGFFTSKVTSGTLPTGLTIQNGVLVGTPSEADTFNFTVLFTDQETGETLSQAYEVVIAAA